MSSYLFSTSVRHFCGIFKPLGGVLCRQETLPIIRVTLLCYFYITISSEYSKDNDAQKSLKTDRQCRLFTLQSLHQRAIVHVTVSLDTVNFILCSTKRCTVNCQCSPPLFLSPFY